MIKVLEQYIGQSHGRTVLLFKTEKKWFMQGESRAPNSSGSYNTRLEEISEQDAMVYMYYGFLQYGQGTPLGAGGIKKGGSQ